jgi:N4-gp56 family major capsid protein
MATTDSAAIAAAVTFKVQAKVLENLRAELVFANAEWSESGDFDPGTDTLMFTSFADLSASTTPLTEGTAPAKRALVMGTVTLQTDQYGDLLSITDVAKVKSAQQIVSIGSERLTRSSKELLDTISRDVIAAGGTPYYAGAANAARADLASTDIATVDSLRRMAWQMFKSKIPRAADGYFRLLVSPDVAADISADDDFIDAVKYTDRMPLLKNEIGAIAGFRVMSVVDAPTFSSTTTVHASIAFGAIKGWGAGELQSLETAHIAPGGDHTDPLGQEELLGYKVMFGVAVLSNAYYFRFESAASDLTP